jgi:hypothetical protein
VEQASWFIDKGFFSSTKRPAPTAARLCLESNYAGYTDWYLPTIRELILMYENLKKRKLGNFERARYWSSSEIDSSLAWYFAFSGGVPDIGYNKKFDYYVRAVRAF